MALNKTIHSYKDNEQEYLGLFLSDSAQQAKATVLIAHTWEGRAKFVETIGERLVALGYQAFAIDMYGEGKTEQTPAKCEALMKPLIENRSDLQKRINLALNYVKALEEVDEEKIIAIGYCFGGLCVLDLARSGADLLGVVSFHGLLNPPDQGEASKIKSKVLVLHGHDDPMVPIEQVNALKQELTQAEADWQLHAYGNTVHAFTNTHANIAGTAAYNANSDKRSWQSLLNFFNELLIKE